MVSRSFVSCIRERYIKQTGNVRCFRPTAAVIEISDRLFHMEQSDRENIGSKVGK
jgi:hypothetical protein